MTHEEKTKVWNEALQWGQRKAFADLYYQTDKPSVLITLFRKASLKAKKCRLKKEAEKWEAYSEGFRHAINILENLGDAIETYNGILNPSIKMKLTAKDVQEFDE